MAELVIPEDFCHSAKPVGKTSHSDGENKHFIWGEGNPNGLAFDNDDVNRRGAIILIIGMIGWGGLFVPFVMLGMFSELEESSVDPTAMMGMFSELEESSVDPTAMMGMMAGFGVIVIVWGIGMFVLFIWQILNSRKLCKQYNEYFEEHGKPPW